MRAKVFAGLFSTRDFYGGELFFKILTGYKMNKQRRAIANTRRD